MGNPTYTYISLTSTNDTYDISRSTLYPYPTTRRHQTLEGGPGGSGKLYTNPHAGTERITTFFNNTLHPDNMPTSTRRQPKHYPF